MKETFTIKMKHHLDDILVLVIALRNLSVSESAQPLLRKRARELAKEYEDKAVKPALENGFADGWEDLRLTLEEALAWCDEREKEYLHDAE